MIIKFQTITFRPVSDHHQICKFLHKSTLGNMINMDIILTNAKFLKTKNILEYSHWKSIVAESYMKAGKKLGFRKNSEGGIPKRRNIRIKTI